MPERYRWRARCVVDETELVLKWKSLPRKDGDTNLLANSGTLVIEVNVLTVEMEVDVDARRVCRWF